MLTTKNIESAYWLARVSQVARQELLLIARNWHLTNQPIRKSWRPTSMLHILHLEYRREDALLIQHALAANGIHTKIALSSSRSEFLSALEQGKYDLILADNVVPGFGGLDALKLARERFPNIPVICVSGAATDAQALATLNAGATDYVLKDQPWQIVAAVRSAQQTIRLERAYRELEQHLEQRTNELDAAYRELESFPALYHDLGAPLRAIRGYSELLLRQGADKLDEDGRDWLKKLHSVSGQMGHLITDLLRLWKSSRCPLKRETVNLSDLARATLARLAAAAPERAVEVHISEGLQAEADKELLAVVLENLLSNAWKFTSKTPQARIQVGSNLDPDGSRTFYVCDNGVGFDLQSAQQLFQPFKRFHGREDFPGSGIGLATAQRIIERLGGRIWAEAAVNHGAKFSFTLGSPSAPL